jgi:hypothetical protein
LCGMDKTGLTRSACTDFSSSNISHLTSTWPPSLRIATARTWCALCA